MKKIRKTSNLLLLFLFIGIFPNSSLGAIVKVDMSGISRSAAKIAKDFDKLSMALRYETIRDLSFLLTNTTELISHEIPELIDNSNTLINDSSTLVNDGSIFINELTNLIQTIKTPLRIILCVIIVLLILIGILLVLIIIRIVPTLKDSWKGKNK